MKTFESTTVFYFQLKGHGIDEDSIAFVTALQNIREKLLQLLP